jgi:hypothetical protein
MHAKNGIDTHHGSIATSAPVTMTQMGNRYSSPALAIPGHGDKITMSVVSKLVAVLVLLSIGFILGILARRVRLATFRAAETIGEGRTTLRLVAGPWAGKIVKIDGVPQRGTVLSSWTWGLVGRGVHKGHYVVNDVIADQRTGTASWRVDQEGSRG